LTTHIVIGTYATGATTDNGHTLWSTKLGLPPLHISDNTEVTVGNVNNNRLYGKIVAQLPLSVHAKKMIRQDPSLSFHTADANSVCWHVSLLLPWISKLATHMHQSTDSTE